MFNLDKNISAAIKVLEDENSFKTFNDYLVKFAPIFKDFLEVYLNNTRTTFETDKHKDCDKYLYDPFFEYSKNFGKLHRPLTCIAACLAANGGDCSKIDEVFPVAACIEDFQTAVLIHDDIADDGRIRRGRPCMHITYDKGLAINAGDFGLVATVGSSLEELKNTSYTDSKILKIVENLIFMEYMTIEGQAMDLG